MKYYEKHDLLTKGYTGAVFYGENLKTKAKVAIKIITLDQPDQFERLRTILNLLIQNKSPYIVDHLAWEEEPSMTDLSPRQIQNRNQQDQAVTFNIVMELCPGGNLLEYLKKNDFEEGESRWKVVKKFSSEIIQGLMFLHQLNITHRKLKITDVVISDKGSAKISGLGVTVEKYNDDAPYADTAHLAPEYVSGKIVGKSADLWSFGVILFQLINWSHDISSMLMYSEERIENALKHKPKAISELCLSCLKLNPNDRPTCGEVFKALNDVVF